MIDGFIKRPVKDDLIKAHDLIQRCQQVEVHGSIGEQSPTHHLVHAEGQDRFGLRHDGLPLDGRVDEIPSRGRMSNLKPRSFSLAAASACSVRERPGVSPPEARCVQNSTRLAPPAAAARTSSTVDATTSTRQAAIRP